MSEQNQVILDTSQAKAALVELDKLLLKVDKSMDGITADALVRSYAALKSNAATIRAEFEKVAGSTGKSATSMKLYAAQLDAIRAKTALVKRDVLALSGAIEDQAKAASAKISYRVALDGGSVSFSEASKYTKSQVKELAEAKKSADELRVANAAVLSKTTAWRKGQQSIEGLREYLGLPRADQQELAKLKAYYTLQAKTASQEIATANAAVTAKTTAWRKGQQSIEGLREYLGLPRADQQELAKLKAYYTLQAKTASQEIATANAAVTAKTTAWRKGQQSIEGLREYLGLPRADQQELAKLKAYYAQAERMAAASQKVFDNFSVAGQRGKAGILAKVVAASEMDQARAISSYGAGIAGLVPRLTELQAILARTEGPIKAVSSAKKDLGAKAEHLGGRMEGLTDRFTRFTKGQQEAHAAIRGVAGSLGALWVTYGAFMPLIAGAAVGSAMKSAVNLGAEFEYQLTFVKALGGESAEAVQSLSKAAKDLSSNGMYGPTEVAGGLRILAQAGLNANEALQALPATLDLATVGEMKMEDAAITLVGVMNAFGKSVSDIPQIGDMFAKAAAVSQVSVLDMTQAMRMASVVGEQYGASMEDTAAALTLLGQLNIKGTAAGTSLRNMLKELYTPLDRSAKMMDQLGLKTKDAEGKLRSFPDVIYDLKAILEQFDPKSQTDILQNLFGERGAKEAIAMLSETREEWNKLRTDISDSNGFMNAVASELEATTKGSMTQAFNTLKVTMIDTFESTEGAVGDLALRLKTAFASEEFRSVLAGIASSVVVLMEAIAASTPVLVAAAGAWVTYKAAVIGFGAAAAISRIVTGLTGAVVAMTGAMGPAVAGGIGLTGVVRGLGAAFMASAGPIGLAAAALGSFSYWVYATSGTNLDKLKSGVNNLEGAMEALHLKTKAANDSLKEQLRLRGLAPGSSVTDAEASLNEAKKGLEAAKAARDAAANSVFTLETLKDSPLNAVRKIIGVAKDSAALSDLDEGVRKAEENYNASKRLYEDTKRMEAEIKADDARAQKEAEERIKAGQRNFQAEEFISAGEAAKDPVAAEIAKLDKAYEEVKKVYADKPAELAKAKDAYDAQVAQILARNKKGGSTKGDRLPRAEVDSAEKLANAEYDQAMASIEFYKKGLDLRKNARMVGELEYQQALDALAELEIEKGIERENYIQAAITDALTRVKDPASRENLEGRLEASLQKEQTLMTKAYTDKALAQIKAEISRKEFLENVEKLEAESFGSRLTAQQQFIRDWNANNQALMDRAMADGDMESFMRLLNIKDRGMEDAKKEDNSKLASLLPGNTRVQLTAALDQYREYYTQLETFRQQQYISEEEYATALIELETRKQRTITDLHIQAAQERLDLGTGGWDDVALTALARVQEGFTTFSAGTASLLADFHQTFTDGFANSIGRAIVYADDFRSALASVAQEGLSQLISGLVKLGVQWMVNAAIGNTIQATAAASSAAVTAAQAAAAASAWAPAAALASLATSGANATPAMIGMSTTTSLAKAIAATSYAGAFDKGGIIPSGKWGIVGEFGPEIVSGPANVTSREKTAEMARQAMAGSAQGTGSAEPPQVNLRIVNVTSDDAVESYLQSSAGERVLTNFIQRNANVIRSAVG